MEVFFYRAVCSNLAHILRGLHARELRLSTTSKSFANLRLYGEAVVCAWSGYLLRSVRGGVDVANDIEEDEDTGRKSDGEGDDRGIEVF